MELYFMRHGKPEFPASGRFCLGRADLSLSKEGRRQAEEAIDTVREAGIEMIYTSPLCRAVETARIVSAGTIPVMVDRDLTELDMGEWEGLTFGQIRREYPDLYEARKDDFLIPPPCGESREAGYARFAGAVERIRGKDHSRVLIVAHRSVLAAYTGRALDYGQIVRWTKQDDQNI